MTSGRLRLGSFGGSSGLYKSSIGSAMSKIFCVRSPKPLVKSFPAQQLRPLTAASLLYSQRPPRADLTPPRPSQLPKGHSCINSSHCFCHPAPGLLVIEPSQQNLLAGTALTPQNCGRILPLTLLLIFLRDVPDFPTSQFFSREQTLRPLPLLPFCIQRNCHKLSFLVILHISEFQPSDLHAFSQSALISAALPSTHVHFPASDKSNLHKNIPIRPP